MGGDHRYQGRLVIPYLTPVGVVQLRFRTVFDSPDHKYLSEFGAQSLPYNVLVLSGTKQHVYITEGELDAITATMCGLPAVGFDGATKWKSYSWRMFRYRQVTVLADGDKAGLEFAQRCAQDIEGCKIISMPPGEDVNSYFVKHSMDSLRKLVGA